MDKPNRGWSAIYFSLPSICSMHIQHWNSSHENNLNPSLPFLSKRTIRPFPIPFCSFICSISSASHIHHSLLKYVNYSYIDIVWIYLFGTARGLISRVEIHNYWLSLEAGETHILPILIFECEIRWLWTFIHLSRNIEHKKRKEKRRWWVVSKK